MFTGQSFFFNFIYFLSALGLRCYVWPFSSCGEWGLLFVAVLGLLIAVASLVAEHGLQAWGLQQLQHASFSSCSARALGRAVFSSCGTWAQQLWLAGSRVQAQQLWHTGLVAPQHVGSSQTRDRTHVPCIGRRILNHCATRGQPLYLFCKLSLQVFLIKFYWIAFFLIDFYEFLMYYGYEAFFRNIICKHLFPISGL